MFIRSHRLVGKHAIGAISVAAAALVAGCASDPYDTTYVGDPVYSVYDERSDYAGRAYPVEEARYAPAYQTNARSYGGVNGARVAHRLYGDARAERVDGDCERVVYIERGETLSDIAEYCDVPVAAIIDANPDLLNPRYVSVGERIVVPGVRGNVYDGAALSYRNVAYTEDYLPGGSLQRTGSGDLFYTIRRGDTLAELSYRYDIPLREIYRANSGLNPRELQVGQRVLLPAYAATAPARRDARPYAYDPELAPLVSITPARGPLDGEIRVLGENFYQGQKVTVLVGGDRNNMRELTIVETDGDGRIDEVIELPRDYGDERALFAFRADRLNDDLYSETYIIERAPRRTARAGDRVHVVRDGQSLAWIARRYGVPMGELRSLNDGVDFARLRGGERLILPASARIDADIDAYSSTEPVFSAIQSGVYYGDEVSLAGEGFPADTPIAIYGGSDRNSLKKLADARSGPGGRFAVDVVAPDDYLGDSMVFVAAIEDGPRTILSERVRFIDRPEPSATLSSSKIVGARTAPATTPHDLERGIENDRRGGFFSRLRRDDRIVSASSSAVGGVDSAGSAAIVGILTDEGEKCPALRDDAGNLFTLLGDLEGFDDGDRVLVRGAVRADDRICGQAETVQLYEIEAAPW